MDRMPRFLAAALLAVLLPVQGYAGACAQICAVANAGTAPAAMAADGDAESHCAQHGPESAPAPADGEASVFGAGKCCQAHVFTLDQAPGVVSADKAPPARETLVARWSSFIPDEPSPPPIAAFANA